MTSYLPMESLPKAPPQQPRSSLLLLPALSGNAVAIPMGIGVPGHSSQLRHQDCLHTVFLRCLCITPYPGHLVNLHDGFWRVVDVDIHQRRVQRSWKMSLHHICDNLATIWHPKSIIMNKVTWEVR